MARRNYKEGQWFLAPVPDSYLADAPDHRFGACLVARGTRGWIVFVYVFGPWQDEPEPSDLLRLQPGDELLSLLLPDLWIRDGRLPFICADPEFSRERWPMPEFGMYMGGNNRATAIRTSDDSPFEAIETREVSPNEVMNLPEWSSGAVGVIFRKLADPGSSVRRISDVYRPPGGTTGESPSLAGKKVQVDFVVPGADRNVQSQVRDALSERGWVPSRGAAVTNRKEEVLISGIRRIAADEATTLRDIDDAMQKIADPLPGVKYDGHGVHL